MINEILPLMGCPLCYGELGHQNNSLSCKRCGHLYETKDGIPILVESFDEGEGRGAIYYSNPQNVEKYYMKRVCELRRAHYGIEHFPTEGTLLDVGCGPGVLSMVAARRGVRVVGMDLSFSMVRFARDKARELGLANTFFLVGDSQRLPFRSNSIDCVVNYANLAHVPNPRKSISDMARVAAPSGRLIVQSINHFSLPVFYMKRGQKRLRQRALEAIRMCWSLRRNLSDEDCRLDVPHKLDVSNRSGTEIDLDTNNVISFYVYDMCSNYCEIVHYETFPNSRGWHFTLNPDLSIVRERRALPLRLKDSIFGLCDRVPGLRHMGTDIFIVCRPRVQSSASVLLTGGQESVGAHHA